MENLVKEILGFFKSAGFLRGLSASVVLIVSLLIWKIDPVQMWDRWSENKAKEAAEKPTSFAPPQEGFVYKPAPGYEEVREIDTTLQSLTLSKEVAAFLVYKFVPGVAIHEYQGRILVASKVSNDLNEAQFVKETGAIWIPIWSGRQSVEKILSGHNTHSAYDAASGTYKFYESDETDESPSVNKDLISGTYGIKEIYRYPVSKDGRVIGYIAVYAKEALTEQSQQEINRIKGKIGAYL